MNIKEFTESAIAIYLEKGGTVHKFRSTLV